MDPPPIPSVLMRGEWSLGKVLEVYWKYSMIGDTYLGRCLAGFDPDQPNVATSFSRRDRESSHYGGHVSLLWWYY
jgi:hypothetical protein